MRWGMEIREAGLVSVNNIDFVHLGGKKRRRGEDSAQCAKQNKMKKKNPFLFGRWNEKRQRLQEMVDIFC